MITGVCDDLCIGDVIFNGEIEVYVGDWDYINKQHAIDIIKHLANVFDIKQDELMEEAR